MTLKDLITKLESTAKIFPPETEVVVLDSTGLQSVPSHVEYEPSAPPILYLIAHTRIAIT
jgi:hypothetical protein